MKSIRNLLGATLLTAGAVLAVGVSFASAADEARTVQPPPGPQGWHHHGGPWQLLSKLDLTAAQKQQVNDVMTAARPQMQSLHEQLRANLLKLRQMQPTDPNYGNITSQVSQTQGSLSAQLVVQRADVRAQIFNLLTPAQQTQLAALEAQMAANPRRGAWGGRRGANASAEPPAP